MKNNEILQLLICRKGNFESVYALWYLIHQLGHNIDLAPSALKLIFRSNEIIINFNILYCSFNIYT